MLLFLMRFLKKRQKSTSRDGVDTNEIPHGEAALLNDDIKSLDLHNPNWRDAYKLNGAIIGIRSGIPIHLVTKAYGEEITNQALESSEYSK